MFFAIIECKLLYGTIYSFFHHNEMFQLCMGTGDGYLRYKEMESDDQAPERDIWKEEKGSYSTLPINTVIDYLSVQIYFTIKD